MSSPVQSDRAAAHPFDPAELGLGNVGSVWANLSAAALSEHAVRRGEAFFTDLGAVAAFTGNRTGRSPKDKFTVKEAPVADQIDWTANQPMAPEAFARLRDLSARISRIANFTCSMASPGPIRATGCRFASSPRRRGTVPVRAVPVPAADARRTRRISSPTGRFCTPATSTPIRHATAPSPRRASRSVSSRNWWSRAARTTPARSRRRCSRS